MGSSANQDECIDPKQTSFCKMRLHADRLSKESFRPSVCWIFSLGTIWRKVVARQKLKLKHPACHDARVMGDDPYVIDHSHERWALLSQVKKELPDKLGH
eukprot:4308182-Amphidinium_carterae.1